MLPKFFPRFKINLIKTPTGIFVEATKEILRFIWKFKGPRMAKVFWKKSLVKGLILLSVQTYY